MYGEQCLCVLQVEDRLAQLENRVVKRLGIKQQLAAEKYDPSTGNGAIVTEVETYDNAADVVKEVYINRKAFCCPHSLAGVHLKFQHLFQRT